MKQGISILCLNLVSLLCVGISGYMVINGIGNWGWFFGLGVLSAHVKSKEQ